MSLSASKEDHNFLQYENLKYFPYPEGIEFVEESSAKLVIEYLHEILQATLNLPFTVFIDFVNTNSDFNTFVVSYCVHRHRPNNDNNNNNESDSESERKCYNIELLYKLDHLVILLIIRALTPSEEECEEQVHSKILTSLSLTRLTVLMDITAIIGDSNRELSKLLLQAASSRIPDFHISFQKLLKEALAAVADINESIINIRSDIFHTNTSSNGKLNTNTKRRKDPIHLHNHNHKKKELEDKKLLKGLEKMQQKKIEQIESLDMEEIKDLAFFSLDIINGLVGFLNVLPGTTWVTSQILASNGNPAKFGKQLFYMFRSLYDEVAPLLESIVNEAKQKKEKSKSESQCSSFGNFEVHVKQIESTIFCLDAMRKRLIFATTAILHAAEILSNTRAYSNASDQQNDLEADAETENEQCSWVELLQELVWSTGPPIGLPQSDRVFVADLVWNQGDTLRNYLVNDANDDSGEDEETVDYVLNAAIETAPVPKKEVATRTFVPIPAWQLTAENDSSIQKYHEKKQQEQVRIVSSVAAVREIFPDLGEGFVYACLECFEWNTDRTIDALLTDNLPPAVAFMDRKELLQLERLAVNVQKANKILKEEEEEKEFKKMMRNRIREQERAEERDIQLLKTYTDDYDDQYDDVRDLRGSGDKNSNSANRHDINSKIDWSVSQTDIKRVNTLMREKEEEVAFWEGMKNTNVRGISMAHKKIADSDGEGDGNGEDSGVINDKTKDTKEGKGKAKLATNTVAQQKAKGPKMAHAQAQGQAQGQGQDKGRSRDSAGTVIGEKNGDKPKYNTKKFDKHRQKDKSLKKGG
jgi:hypothetical protein